MRYAILSDVHASIEALDAALADARAQGAARIVCAGDLVGYHADPEACVERVLDLGVPCVAGNHDRVAAGIAEPNDFAPLARHAVLWTRGLLSPSSRAFLGSLPLARVIDDRFLLVHAALHPEPNADLHLSRAPRVRRSIEALDRGSFGVRIAFFGHTHRGVVHALREGALTSIEPPEDVPMPLSVHASYLVNPGSVGQPRDGDPRASYAIYDTETRTVRFRRVRFDRDACLAKAARAGLVEPETRGALARICDGLRALTRRRA